MSYLERAVPSRYKFAWSISSMDLFDMCPRRFREEQIYKNKQEFGDAAQWGVAVHDALEKAVKTGTQRLPARFGMFQYVADAAFAQQVNGWHLNAEAEHCRNRDLSITGWFDADAWVRCKIDLTLTKGNVASVIDYKTGKVPDDRFQKFGQLELSNLFTLDAYPHVDVVMSKYWYIAKGGVGSMAVTTRRGDRDAEWNRFLERAAVIEESVATNNFPPKQSGICRQYCHVTSCEFNGRR